MDCNAAFVIILLVSLFFHVVADFSLQGILSSMKQKEWWSNEISKMDVDETKKIKMNSHYRNDYKICLLAHGFHWSVITFVPSFIILFFTQNVNASFISYLEINLLKFVLILIVNTVFHIYIDNLKANKFEINLIEDQYWHYVQILLTCILLIV